MLTNKTNKEILLQTSTSLPCATPVENKFQLLPQLRGFGTDELEQTDTKLPIASASDDDKQVSSYREKHGGR